MQINLTMLGVGLAVMFFGYFFGLFEGRGQGYKRRKKEEDEEKKTKAAFEKPLPPASVPPAPVRENNLLKISLDENQQPRLDLDGQRVDTTQLTPEQRKRLIDLMVMARPWIDGSTPQKTAVPPKPTMPTVNPPQTAPAPAPIPAPKPASSPSVPPTTSPKQDVTAPTTMVSQIDAILQTHLTGSPLSGRGIRLVESPEGTVTVVVGIDNYPGVNEVPDPAIQAAIRAAISEWEQRYTPT